MQVPYQPYPVKILCAPDKEPQRVVRSPDKSAVLTPAGAWRLLKKRTQAQISRPTFYRWLSSGKVFSYRLGYHLYIPTAEIEAIIKQCQEGKWF
jgi:hypothetical protein